MQAVFYDGTEVTFEDGSNKLSMIKKVSNLGELDAIRSLFTNCNMTGMKLGNDTVYDVVPVDMTIKTPPDAEEIYAIFTNRVKTELEQIHEELSAQSEVLDALLGL